MRNLLEVIEAMIEEVPEDEKVFRDRLESLKSSVLYSPPENMGLWWRQVAESLHHQIGDEEPVDGWQRNVIDVWMDITTIAKGNR